MSSSAESFESLAPQRGPRNWRAARFSLRIFSSKTTFRRRVLMASSIQRKLLLRSSRDSAIPLSSRRMGSVRVRVYWSKSKPEALDFVVRVLETHEFGPGGDNLLLEEALTGDELSFIVLTDGRDYVP